MKGLSHEEVAARIALELEGVESFWIAPELSTIAPPRAAVPREQAGLVIIRASELSETGHVRGPRPASEPRVWAVVDTPIRIVQRCTAPVARVEKAFLEVAVIDVAAEGLVIVELAPGVSAQDLQAVAEPTLRISSRVDVMRSSQ